MSAASREDLSRWFDLGVSKRASHLIVVCDTFDWDDYPVFADNDSDAIGKFQEHHRKNMQKVMEVYDLRMDKQAQMSAHRAWNLPKAIGDSQ